MTFNSSKFLCAVLIAAFSGFAGSGPLLALEVTPDYHLFKGKPGQKLTRTITVTNNDAVSQKISVGFESRIKGDASSYISFSAKDFELKSGETRDVAMTCRVPKETAGELYGNLVVHSAPAAGGGYEIRMRPEVCLQIEGTQVSDVIFAGVSAVRSETGVRVEANLINNGNTKLAPKLVAYLDGDRNADRGEVLSARKTVFYPEEKGTFTGHLSLPVAVASPSSAVSYPSPFPSGQQRIFVTAFYRAADGRVAKKTQSFMVEAKP